MQRGRAVEQNRAFGDHRLQRLPDLGPVALDQAARAFDIGGVVVLHQARNHKRAVQFERHAFREAALI